VPADRLASERGFVYRRARAVPPPSYEELEGGACGRCIVARSHGSHATGISSGYRSNNALLRDDDEAHARAALSGNFGTTRGRSLARGASTPWNRVSGYRGGGTCAQSLAMHSTGGRRLRFLLDLPNVEASRVPWPEIAACLLLENGRALCTNAMPPATRMR